MAEEVVQRKPRKEEVLAHAHAEGNRVRVLIGSRKMKLPGALVRQPDGRYQVQTNWRRTYEIPTDQRLHEIEIADDRNRYQTIETED